MKTTSITDKHIYNMTTYLDKQKAVRGVGRYHSEYDTALHLLSQVAQYEQDFLDEGQKMDYFNLFFVDSADLEKDRLEKLDLFADPLPLGKKLFTTIIQSKGQRYHLFAHIAS